MSINGDHEGASIRVGGVGLTSHTVCLDSYYYYYYYYYYYFYDERRIDSGSREGRYATLTPAYGGPTAAASPQGVGLKRARGTNGVLSA